MTMQRGAIHITVPEEAHTLPVRNLLDAAASLSRGYTRVDCEGAWLGPEGWCIDPGHRYTFLMDATNYSDLIAAVQRIADELTREGEKGVLIETAHPNAYHWRIV
jgi:hypothetical protein